MKQVIYPNEFGGVALMTPAEGWTAEFVARKDVPIGVPYKIVDSENLPQDHTFFNAWQADFSNPDGHGIGPNQWFIEQYNAEIAFINAEQIPARLPDDEQTAEDYQVVVAQWETDKASRIAQLNKKIAIQQAEMNT